MKANLYTSRRTDAQSMADQLVKAVLHRAETKFCGEDRLAINAFTVGYLNSLLATVAAQSPAGMKELASALKYAKENQ
jgi:hypothetical protein